MNSEGSGTHVPHSSWSRNGDTSRGAFFTSPQLSSSSFRAGTSSNHQTTRQDFATGRRRSESPPTPIEHHYEPHSPPRRPTGTFEYGHTYGSSTYRQDQTAFLGTPKLSTRYQPDHASYRQLNRPLHDNRRKQFSPFMQYPKHQDKVSEDDSSESRSRRGHTRPDEHRGREFPVNHDWYDSPTSQEAPVPVVYSACALTLWKIDGYYGFLCDRNLLYGNLHFYADASTVVEEEGTTLGAIRPDRLQRGHRVEIEAEFMEPDLSDTENHYLIYVRKILKLGTEESLEMVYSQVLIPLTKKKPSPYYRALAESGDLAYVHPSILFLSSLIDSIKQHLPSCRSVLADNALELLISNRTVRGDVTVAPRWVGDTIGRLCNLKRVLISCEPYGETAQGYGTVVEVVAEASVVIQSHSRSDRVHCSLMSACPDTKITLKVGSHVRYTACLDLPESTYKWRCISVTKTSRFDGEESKLNLDTSRSKRALTASVGNYTLPKYSVDEQNCAEDARKERNDVVEGVSPRCNDDVCKAFSKDDRADGRKKSVSPPRRVYRPLGYPAEANEEIPVCKISMPRKVFRYGDEPPCLFTIPDELERSHYANFSSLYKSMEDFLLRHRHRRDKNIRRMQRRAEALKVAKQEEENEDGNVERNGTQEDSRAAANDSAERFQFVGVADDIGKILLSSRQTDGIPPQELSNEPQKPKEEPPRKPDGFWYRRSKTRVYPCIVIAEYIENRDEEKDSTEDVNVYRLSRSITVRNSGIFVDDGLHTESSEAVQGSDNLGEVPQTSRDCEPSLLFTIQNDEIMRRFFSSLLTKTTKQ